MTQNEKGQYVADEGMVLRRKQDGFYGKSILEFGTLIVKGVAVQDTIENYEEVSEESVKPKEHKHKSAATADAESENND